MHDHWNGAILICGEHANDFLLEKIVNVSAVDSGRRLSIYGQSLLAIKARFDVSTPVFQKHVKDLNNCADKAIFLQKFHSSCMEEAVLALENSLIESELETLNLINLAEEERFRSLQAFFHRFDSLAERKIAFYKFSLQEMWEAFCAQNTVDSNLRLVCNNLKILHWEVSREIDK